MTFNEPFLWENWPCKCDWWFGTKDEDGGTLLMTLAVEKVEINKTNTKNE